MSEPTQFAFRTSKSIGVANASPTYDSLPGFEKPEGHLRCCAYSPDGRYFAWAAPEKVIIVDASVGHIVATLAAPKVFELGFSRLGTYIITWQQPTKDENGDAIKNLKVWRVISPGQSQAYDLGEEAIVGRFVQKSQTNWNLQYTQDEKYCARSVTNEIQFYESGNLAQVWIKLRVEGVRDFAVAPGSENRIVTFVPAMKGQPGSVKVFNVPSFDAPISQKNFFKGDKVQFKWNNQGTGLIVKAETEVDQSGKNYEHGETTLYLLNVNGDSDSRIDLDKEGPVHDVAWSPNSKEFSVVYGRMPMKTSIFNNKAEATHSFPLGPRNTIKFSPHGRFLLVAGFGNLAGQVDIYDLEKNYEKVSSLQAANASVCDWSPDGKYILTAIARLKVDNGIRIYHVGGGLMYNEDMHELLHVSWRPQSPTTHPLTDPLNPVPEPHPSALEYLNTHKTPSKPAGAYRPPGARGTSTPLAFMREDQGGAAYVSNGSTSLTSLAVNGFGPRRHIPGADPTTVPGSELAEGDMSKAALKNKKKRENKKAKDVAEKNANLTTGDEQMARTRSPSRSPERRGDRRDHQRNRSRNNSELRPHSQNRDGNRDGDRGDYRDGNRRRGHSQNRNGQGARSPGRSPGPHNRNPRSPRNGNDPSHTNKDPASPEIRRHPQLDIAAASGVAPDLTVTTPGGSTPQDKKIRALTKKLRAIDDLKMRRATGEALEATQVKKMDTEESVRRELEQLGWKDGE